MRFVERSLKGKVLARMEYIIMSEAVVYLN